MNRKNEFLSVFLAVMMLIGILPVAGGTKAEAEDAMYQVGDLVEFGSYPQRLVTNEVLINQLNATDSEWISYGYYSGTGNYDGSMAPSDYMKYRDVTVGGNKYRAVHFTKYRPGYTSLEALTTTAQSGYQDKNGYYINTTYWFKFEPVLWRILDSDKGLMLSERILDSQAYNNYSECATDNYRKDYWGNAEHSYYTFDYAKSSIRDWLNRFFFNTAFIGTQKNKIRHTSLSNTSTWNSDYNSNSTYDKIFLLSESESERGTYGFNTDQYSSDPARAAQGTDYAKAQGLNVFNGSTNQNWNNYIGYSDWLLRSPYYEGNINKITSYGAFVYAHFGGDGGHVSTYHGIRPAMRVDLSAVTPAHEEPEQQETPPKIYSLSINGIAGEGNIHGTDNDTAAFYTRMCANTLDGYIIEDSNQHTYGYSNTDAVTISKLISMDFQNTDDDDLSFFFFSGHSVSNSNGIHLGISLGESYISWQNLVNLLCSSIRGEIMVILDCCHAEYFITKGIASNSELSDADKARFHVLTACRENETSKPEDLVKTLLFRDINYGCFSFYLEKGLGFVNGYLEADSSGDGIVSLYELYRYISPKTADHDMTPQMFGGDIELYQTSSEYIDYYTAKWNSSDYNVDLAKMTAALANAVYTPEAIETEYRHLGFTNEYYGFGLYDYDGGYDPLRCGYAVGFKKSSYNDDVICLISVRGSSNTADWIGNFSILTLDAGKHIGFSIPAEHIIDNVNSLIESNGITGNIKYVITGHSRGAAVANLTAVKLMERGVPADNVYCYDFACPDVVCKAYIPLYDNIFNLCNNLDVVTHVPGPVASVFTLPDAVWGKYGTTYCFTEFGGLALGDRHQMDLYLNFFDRRLTPDDFGDISSAANTITGWITNIFCPVDVAIADVNGNVIASVINGEVNYHDNVFGDVIIFTDGDKKVIYINGDRDFNVNLVGTDNGTMTYSVEKYDLVTGEVLEEKSYTAVALTEGKLMYSPVSEAENTSDIELFIVEEKENGEIKPTFIIDIDGTEKPINTAEEQTDPVPPDTPTEPVQPSNENGKCGWCNKVHANSFWERIVAFVHAILYFFTNLFK